MSLVPSMLPLNYLILYFFFFNITTCSAVVFWLFTKPVNLPQKTVGYRLTLIQSSNLYFSLIRVILLELNHCCAYMQYLCCNGTNLLFHFFGNIVLSYSELPMIILKLKAFFMLSGHISVLFLLHYKPTRLWNRKRFWLKAVGSVYRSVNLFTTALNITQQTLQILNFSS